MNRPWSRPPPCRRWPLDLLAGMVLLAAAGSLPRPAGAAEPAQRMQASADGQAVVDTRLGLIWSRCVEGMQWDGKACRGAPLRLTLSEAQARAAARKKADGLPWRLPRTAELQRLLDGRTGNEGVDARLFPADPAGLHWSSTANVRAPGAFNPYRYDNVMRGNTGDDRAHMAFLHGWAVDMGTGQAYGDVAKRSKLAVRLVRSQATSSAEARR